MKETSNNTPLKVAFFSNFLNHHQTLFCDEMHKQLNGRFTFVSTQKTPETFLLNGYQDCTDYIYNLNAYIDDIQHREALQLALDADVVIFGAAPETFIQHRLRQNKLTFRYSERLFKQGILRLLNPRVLFPLIKSHTLQRNKNIHLLCASAYAANDFDLLLAYPNKKYKWGYFTEVPEQNIDQIIETKPDLKTEILWVSRLIDWKHPELAVLMAKALKEKGHNFHLKMIGSGVMQDEVKDLITKENLTEYVSLLGSMPNKDVLSHMEKANIFIFTSDRNEGWGAVLNEAMSRGCAVVASHLIGAAPYLIENNKNGLLFESGNLASLVSQTEKLLKDGQFRQRLAKNAYLTMTTQWHPQKAAANFINLAQSIFNQKEVVIYSGPCSRAK